MKINKKFLFILLPICLGIIVIDLVSKELIASSYALGESNNIIPKLINFTYVQNFGAAWNILSGNRAFLIIISLVFIACLVLFYFFERKNGVLFQVGCGLIIGGALGNMVDRIFIGYVIDFIQFDFWQSFPVFNVADMALTIGVVCVILYYIISLFKRGENARKD